MPKIYIHIGLHKTGTTYLQVHVFPLLDLNYICGWSTLFRDVVNRKQYEKKLFISEEDLAGKFWGGINIHKIMPGDYIKIFEKNIKWLNDIFPDAGIIIGFRKHSSFIKSLCSQHIHEGGIERLEKILLYPSINNNKFSYDDFSYIKRLTILESLYGDNIHVYLQEDLKKNPKKVLSNMSEFMGVGINYKDIQIKTENAGLKGGALEFLRWINILLYRLLTIKHNKTFTNKKYKRYQNNIRKNIQKKILLLNPVPFLTDEYDYSYYDTLYEKDFNFVINKIGKPPSAISN